MFASFAYVLIQIVQKKFFLQLKSGVSEIQLRVGKRIICIR